jgi:hypothetical protein
MRIFRALAFLTAVSGCYPIIAHPTRVESGMKLTTLSSFAMVSDSAAGDERRSLAVVPSIDVEAALGIRDTTRTDGTGLRISAFAGFSGYGGSVYLEAPREFLGSFDAGAGVAAHAGFGGVWTPYVQFGRREDEEMSWFVRNSAAFTARHDSTAAAVVWIPTVGIVRQRSNRENVMFLSAVVGRQPLYQGPCLFACEGPSLRTLVMVGASLSFSLMRRYPYP